MMEMHTAVLGDEPSFREFKPLDCAVVLAGAAGQGAFTAGVLEALIVAGIRPEAIAATSSGALNALALARGLVAGSPEDTVRQLVDLWIHEASLWRLAPRSFNFPGALHGRGLLTPRRLIQLMRRAAPAVREIRGSVELYITATPLGGPPRRRQRCTTSKLRGDWLRQRVRLRRHRRRECPMNGVQVSE